MDFKGKGKKTGMLCFIWSLSYDEVMWVFSTNNYLMSELSTICKSSTGVLCYCPMIYIKPNTGLYKKY